MNVLIVGSRSNVFSTLTEEYKKQNATSGGKCIAALFSSERSGDEGDQYIEWNPQSPISARSLCVSGENIMGSIDSIIISISGPPLNEELDFLPATIDSIINNYIKGPVFLLRECQKYFSGTEKKSGTLALVLQEENSSSLLGAPVSAAWSAFVHSVLARCNQGRPVNYKTVGFNCAVNKPDQILDFSAFVYKTLNDEKKLENGKLYKYKKLPF
ncbi:MAG: hypothetical protein Ta2G_02840 [Termitinemataceae bacterium]|nr:MAG: hypothetical protein Ta2G_02840 [Termitinemataceae bacterium]